MNRMILAALVLMLPCFAVICGEAALPELPPDGMILDLNADKGVKAPDGTHVTLWQNQVKAFAAKDFVSRDEGRKEAGSGRPFWRQKVKELGGHHAIAFLQQELVCLDESAFDFLTQGGGATWVAVIAMRAQRVGLKDCNSFFGNLKNGGNYEGLWGNVTDDNKVWWGARNGITFGRFDENNPQLMGPKLDTGRFYVIAGRIPAGTRTVKLELFVNNAKAVASGDFPVNEKSDPSRMAIGQERDAINHPGHESFDGDIARFLIWNRPLTNEELAATITRLVADYKIPDEAKPEEKPDAAK